MIPVPLIRLAHPGAFVSFLERIGSPTERILRNHRLPVYCEDPGAFVPLRNAWALFDEAARREDSALGWHVGQFYGDYKLSRGLLKRIEHAPTLYLALQAFAKLVSAEASHLQLGIHERRDDIVFYTHYPTFKHWPGYLSSQTYQLGIFLDVIRHYLGPHWVPDEMGTEAPNAPAIAHEAFSGSRVRTGRRLGYLTVPRSCLHAPPLSRRVLGDAERSLVLADGFDYVDTVRSLITTYMADGYPSARVIARLMGTSVRTLHRKLSAHGVAYQTLIDGVRFGRAAELLRDRDVGIGDVARSVGFDDPAHVARMFRRVGGLSPREFRLTSRA